MLDISISSAVWGERKNLQRIRICRWLRYFNEYILAVGGDTSKEPSLRPALSSNDLNGDDDRQDLNSIGDITIDSVKDHLL